MLGELEQVDKEINFFQNVSEKEEQKVGLLELSEI
jgi:hypothetical protein